MSTPVLHSVELTKAFTLADKSVLQVLRGVDFAIHPGQFHAVVGKSGSGKSTLMQVLALFDRPTTGKLYWQGQDALTLSMPRIDHARRTMFGFIHQSHRLLPGMSALDNVALPLQITGQPKKQARLRAAHFLDRVGLSDRFHHAPGELSGGERQRVGVARALVTHPRLIIADEPTGSLDGETGKQVFGLLDELRRSEGVALLLVTHDLDLAARADCRWQFSAGQVSLIGSDPQSLNVELASARSQGLPRTSIPALGV